MHQYMLGATLLESSLAEKDLVVLVDTMLTTRQKRALATKKTASRWKEVILPLYSALVNLHLDSCVQF